MRSSPTVRSIAIACVLLLAAAGLAATAAGAHGDHADASPAAPTDSGVESVAERGDASPAATDPVHECAAPIPEDYEDPEGGTAGTIGWVDGYWYDEPIDVDADDGELTEAEIEELAARTAARVEAIRCLTFDEVPPIRTLTRDEFEDDVTQSFEAWATDDVRAYQNARLSTLLLAGTDEDAVEVLREHQTGFPTAFYNTEEEFVGFIADDPDEIEIDEVTLAHELLHALQDQEFGIGEYDRDTNDRDAAVLALIEGDARVVDHQYERACDDGEWEGECVGTDGEGGDSEPSNWGLLIDDFYPYSQGYAFVEHRYETGGWAAVDELYENPPTTTLATTYPNQFDERDLADLTVEDRSDDEWERITFEAGPDRDVVGHHGLLAILIAPTYESGGFTEIVPAEAFLNAQNPRFVIDYDQPETDGWRGDALYGYGDGDDVGAVWKSAWADAGEAQEYADAYEQLIEYRGGERSDEYANVYEFDGEYEMAMAIEHDGDRLWIVTAPTVEELTAVHADLDLTEADDTDDDADAGEGDADDPDGDADADDDTDVDGDTDDSDDVGTDADGDADDPDDEIPGFGPIAAVLAIAGALALARRR